MFALCGRPLLLPKSGVSVWFTDERKKRSYLSADDVHPDRQRLHDVLGVAYHLRVRTLSSRLRISQCTYVHAEYSRFVQPIHSVLWGHPHGTDK